MDRYTFYLLEFLEDIQPASKTNMNDLVSVCMYVCVCVRAYTYISPVWECMCGHWYAGSMYSKAGSGSLLLFYLILQGN